MEKQNIKKNIGELEKCRREREENLNNWKKERADFINYKKDEAKRLEEFTRFANEDLIMEIIEILDDLIIARKNIPPGNTEWLEGFDGTMKKFEGLFKKYGVEKIDTSLEFNPALHEAIEMEEGGNKMEEVKPGYMMHDKVIRPAKVKITK